MIAVNELLLHHNEASGFWNIILFTDKMSSIMFDNRSCGLVCADVDRTDSVRGSENIQAISSTVIRLV